jgi:dTDP-glucose 4,6-dehydratase
LLLNDKSDIVYNVGSENAYSIEGIARELAKVLNPELKIHIEKNRVSSSIGDRYIPSTRKAREELKLEQWIDLTESIRRTAMYITQ